ncbi:MAG: hypothetical protein HDQ95_16365 [Roseburia sp.]|nr:hypothetical protein [Roseburia sp.]
MIENVYEVAYGIWNTLISIAMTLFTTSPTNASGSVYVTTRTLYNSISNIAIPIAIVFFLIAICKDVTSCPPDQQVKRFFGDVLKFGIMVGILANLWDIMGYIMQIADGITNKFGSASSYTLSMSDDLKNVIAEADVKPSVEVHMVSLWADLLQLLSEWTDFLMTKFLFFLTSIVTLIIIVASCISILSSAFQRIIKPLAILPFSSIAVAMGSGSGEATRVTTHYLKSFFGFCLSGAFMVICVKLGVALMSGLIVFDYNSLTLHEKVLYISIQNAITPIMIAGLIKGTDGVLQKFF